MVAKQAKLLRKALKSMSITTASKKIDMNDSSSSESSGENSEDEQMEGVQLASQVPTHTEKQIKKKPKLSRAHYKEMKRELKRRVKIMKSSGSKRKAERMLQTKDDAIKMRFLERKEGIVRMEE